MEKGESICHCNGIILRREAQLFNLVHVQREVPKTEYPQPSRPCSGQLPADPSPAEVRTDEAVLVGLVMREEMDIVSAPVLTDQQLAGSLWHWHDSLINHCVASCELGRQPSEDSGPLSRPSLEKSKSKRDIDAEY